MTEETLRELFREMRDEPVPADSLVRVRSRLAARITRRRWFWAGAFALVPACVLLMALLFRLPAPAPLPPLSPVVSAPLVQPAVIRSAPGRVPRKKQTVPASVAANVPASVATSAPAAVRIETEDPDVVILLVGN